MFRFLRIKLGVFILALANQVWADDTSASGIRIYAVGNGWHVGVLMPASSLNALVPGLRDRFPKADNYEIGWGDMGFYQAKEVTVGLALEALFASKGALLHIVGIEGSVAPFLRGSEVVESCVTPEGYQSMAKLIAQTFVRGPEGQVVAHGRGLYGDSQFYKAVGRYSMFYTCNRWSAEVFQAGGLAMSPRISLTASSVLRSVRQEAKVCAPVGTK